eukprot:jgi/Tetstr1/427873/TSEL_017950.t1
MNLGVADLFNLCDPHAHKYAKPMPKATSWKMADELLVAAVLSGSWRADDLLIVRWAEKAHVHANTAANPSATKAVAESAARQAHAAVEKAVTWCQTAADELPACSEALTAALHTKACVDKAEEQLRRLQAASLGMQVEEEEEEQDDEEDEEDEVQEEGEGGTGHHEPPTDRQCLAMPVPQPPTAP